MVTDIGDYVAETCQHIDNARQSDVAIRNEEALRYEVPTDVWSHGISINDWVEQLSHVNAHEQLPTPHATNEGDS